MRLSKNAPTYGTDGTGNGCPRRSRSARRTGLSHPDVSVVLLCQNKGGHGALEARHRGPRLMSGSWGGTSPGWWWGATSRETCADLIVS